MESTGLPGKIQMSETTAELLLAAGNFQLVERGMARATRGPGKGAFAPASYPCKPSPFPRAAAVCVCVWAEESDGPARR